MIAVIPHKDDLLPLANFQKAIKNSMIEKGFFFYSRPPLWFYLPNNYTAENKEELKAIKLQKLVMEKPYFCDGKVISPLHFTIDGKEFSGEYSHLYLFKGKDDEKKINDVLDEVLAGDLGGTLGTAPKAAQNEVLTNARVETPNEAGKKEASGRKKILTLPKEFRIFRLGIAEKLSENSMAISESTWEKLL